MKGGTTKPCIVTVQTDTGEYMDYVVKIFKQSYLEKGQPIYSEVFGNILAKAFDLNVPNAALIEIPKWLIDELRVADAFAAYAPHELRAGTYFATEYISGKEDYTTALATRYLDKDDIATIFAFDVLLLHKDRRVAKPNLFFKNDAVYLIDHESVLVIGQQTYNNLLSKGAYQYTIQREGRPHLFLNYLSKLQKTATKPDFSTFYEYLRYLDTNLLDGYADQLAEIEQMRFLRHEGDETFDYLQIKRYLCAVKADAPRFLQLLTQLIQ